MSSGIASYPTVAVGDIHVGERHRKDLGDLASLAKSIRDVGLLHPLVVRQDMQLVAGRRRLEAAKELGWKEVPVRVVEGLGDALAALRAEGDENTCRKDYTPSEAVALGSALEELERTGAKRRQQEGGRSGGKASGNLPEASKGDTRDKVAAAVGMSGRTYEKAKAVAEAAGAEPDKYGRLLEAMDRTGRVDGVYRRLQTARQAEAIAREPPPLPAGPFRVIVADPPWAFEKRPDDDSRQGVVPYPTLTIEELKAIPVGGLAHEDAVLWLWSTNAHLPDAFAVLDAWGFAYKTMLTWDKERMGTGDWLRGRTEHSLFAVRGRPTVSLAGQTTLLRAPAREHSRKPDAFYRMVESLCPGSKVELFSRQSRPGWAAHGDEAGRWASAS
jgi:ParB family chromosome partitioning protein